jgi:hypothetical protein
MTYLPPEEVEDNDFYAIQIHKDRLKQLKKHKDCEHHFWIAKCSICGEIIGSDNKSDIIWNLLNHKRL